MITEINWHGWNEEQFHASLVSEAARDVVFLMSIEHQLTGGFKCTHEELPEHMEKAVRHLLENLATVGFGEPGTSSWKPESSLQGAPDAAAKKIVNLWKEDPESWRFLLFVRQNQPNAA